ncbi:helicase C-terminal domain-containing protein [Vagococcus carniphilus]|uniref:helicase C-terminal domain-containing protein n=1 Tax=Vagococcus carniphilus TaxID=218144 RepID=UPI003BA86CF9
MDENIYAVVDIETTGTNPERDKIIQFACVLVQKGKIINYFSTDVNPLLAIPKNIESLTGISNQQVANAPYFEDIAPIISQLISDCVFVAHNVYFDFAFLNSELSRAGEIELKTKCIDTVELSQILYPTSTGFRVSDLAETLNLTHDNPHQALSDAYVTAELFICLCEKLKTIPYVTLKKMTELSYLLGVDNSMLFEEVLLSKESQLNQTEFDRVKTIESISLREKDYTFKEKKVREKKDFPKTNKEKELLFSSSFVNREPQLKMMNTISDFVEKEQGKNLIIEASTGVGKSLGYLMPLSYNNNNYPIIVSTSTIMLQEQLIDSTLEQLKEVTDNDLFGMVLKSYQHYIDLEKFNKTLKECPIEQKQYAINQMAVLTWLIETETGDLDEINLNKQHVFFDHIKHRGVHTLNSQSNFYQEDFVKYLEEKKEVADVIVVNHAFLCEENKRDISLIPKSSILVIDESHKLISQFENQEMISLSFNHVFSLLKKLKESEEANLALAKLNHSKLNRTVELLGTFSIDVREDLHWLERFLIEVGGFLEGKEEVLMENLPEVLEWPVPMRKNLKELITILNEINQLTEDFKQEIIKNMSNIKTKDYFNLLDYLHVLEQLSEWNKHFSTFFKTLEKTNVRWITLKKDHFTLKMLDFSKLSIQTTRWYQSFEKIIYTSGTLQLDVDSSYFEKQLNIPDAKKVKIEDTFDYQKNAKFLVVSKKEKISNQATFIAKTIIESRNIGKESMLVLFTSHHLLKQVYQQLSQHYNQQDVELYAQDITGTKEKIAKQFAKRAGGIILGANSFWEGVDLNLPNLDLIIMTKLPFDPPKRPLIEAKYRFIEEQGMNPFYTEAIPQAGMRLRQGLGRLLRSDADRGVILLLDDRLTKSSYSQQLLAYLPQGLQVEECSLETSLAQMSLFFTEIN